MFTLLSAEAATHQMTAWGQFSTIISKPDNMPVAGALVLVMFFSWVAIRQALRNDRLIRQGKKDQVIEEMQR